MFYLQLRIIPMGRVFILIALNYNEIIVVLVVIYKSILRKAMGICARTIFRIM